MAFTTKKSLLFKIKEGNDDISWGVFFTTYRPLIWMMGSRFNFSAEEKENLVQEVMRDFFNAQSHFIYDRSKGRFRDYFRKIIKSRILQMKAKERRRNERPAPLLGDWPDEAPPELERLWEEEWRMHVLKEARQEIRGVLSPKMIQVFEMWHFQELDPKTIAKDFGISLTTVYNYRNTVLDALRSAVAALEKE